MKINNIIHKILLNSTPTFFIKWFSFEAWTKIPFFNNEQMEKDSLFLNMDLTELYSGFSFAK